MELALRPLPPSRTYVTFLAGAGDYVKGALALAKSLQKVKSAYPLVVAVLGDVPEAHRQMLRLQGCVVREIEAVRPEGDNFNFGMARYIINYSKLRIWLFEEYEKIIYLDSDIIVCDNIDHLFDLPDGRLYAVMDCFCGDPWSQSPQYKAKYCQQCPDKNPWPKHFGEPPAKYFNAGMFVYEPSKKTFHELMDALRNNPPTALAEQDLLNAFFQKLYTPIPMMYNLMIGMLSLHPENIELEEVKVVHYACAMESKPWRCTGNEEHLDREDVKMLMQKWWDVYNDKTLDNPSSGLLLSDATKEVCKDFSANIIDRSELSKTAPRTNHGQALVLVGPAA